MVDWTNTSFPMFGGLYFKRDLEQAAGSLTFTDENSKEVTLDDYAMGPSNNKLNYENGRSKVEFDKGPWSSAVEREVATARREIACVQQLELPRSPYALYTSATYIPNKEKKIRAAECHAQLAKYFMTDDPRPREILKTFKPQKGQDQKDRMEAFIMRERVAYGLRSWMHDNNELWFKALWFQHDYRRYDFSRLAPNLLVDKESYYLSYLATQARRNWRNMNDFDPDEYDLKSYPFGLSSKKVKAIKDETNLASKALQYMWNVKSQVGWQFFQDSGFVRHEDYDWVKLALREEKATFIKTNRKYAHLEELDAVWPSD
ncbi:Phosphotransferase enzyme family protein [Aspergillus sp. HF37]|nr:Phosphotransferase enzyme family protein [Aspergillus sp. HF37]